MDEAVYKQRMIEARLLLDLSLRLAWSQIRAGRVFIFEHPASATSWDVSSVLAIAAVDTVFAVEFDQCAVGLRSPVTLEPMQKRTRFLTNDRGVRAQFEAFQCRCGVPHRQIQGSIGGSMLSKHAAIYPPRLCEELARACARVCGISLP